MCASILANRTTKYCTECSSFNCTSLSSLKCACAQAIGSNNTYIHAIIPLSMLSVLTANLWQGMKLASNLFIAWSSHRM